MGNSGSLGGEASVIYTKNYLNFIRDFLRIILYCETSLSKLEKDEVLGFFKKLQESYGKNPNVDLNLYKCLMRIRKNILARHFEGSLLSKQCLIYTIHEYKYLQECINSKKKMISQPEFAQIITDLEQAIDSEDSPQLKELEKRLTSDKKSWTFFENTFFRGNSSQVIRLSDYHKYLSSQAHLYTGNPTLVWPNKQNSGSNHDLDQVESISESHSTTQAACAVYNINETKVENLVLTCDEFQICHRIFQKNNHKISYISQIPSSTLDIKNFLCNLKYVRVLKLSSLLDMNAQLQLFQFLQDNTLLEHLQANLDGVIQQQFIDTLNNHPNLKFITLFVNSMEKSLKSVRHLKYIMIKAEQLHSIESIVNPQSVILQFEIKNVRFNPYTLSLLNKFPMVFLTCNNNFYSLAQTLFRDLSSVEQFNLMKMFLKTNTIMIDSIMSFTQNEDLQRIENGTLSLAKSGYLYLFITKLLVEYYRESMISKMKIAAFQLNLSPPQCFHPNQIYLDLYFD